MKKYIIDINYEANHTAGSKARLDVNNVAQKEGFQIIKIDYPSNKAKRMLVTNANTKKALKDLAENSLAIVQYPLMNQIFMGTLVKALDKKNVQKVLLIHDVLSLRTQGSQEVVAKEISLMNEFDIVISHNKKMTEWFLENGLTAKVIELGIFDYLADLSVADKALEEGVAFAGNLIKADFLGEIKDSPYPIQLFGPNPAEHYGKGVVYKGSFKPEELEQVVTAKFGLVWDGTSLDSCNGELGEYLKFNNPHKISLYASLSLPIIIWDQAALADFVTEQEVGICVSSIPEMYQVITNLSEADYELMKANVSALASKVKEGYFLKQAISKID